MGEIISQMDNYQSYYHVIPQNENTLILKGLDGKLRKDIHSLCDKMGLHHNSVETKKTDIYGYTNPKYGYGNLLKKILIRKAMSIMLNENKIDYNNNKKV